MKDISCPRCKSHNTDYNKEKDCYYCLDCYVIWEQHYQEVIVSPNNNNPDSSSNDKSSKEES